MTLQDTGTILLLSRGMRLHALYREMAQELARDHRVVVLAAPEEVSSFSALAGVDVECYQTADIPTVKSERRGECEADLRARATDIEQEIGLPLYKAASNYLLYGRFVRSYGGRWNYLQKEREILRAYVGAYDQLSRIFAAYGPDIVFYETIDLMSSYVAFALARRYGVFGLEFRFGALGQGTVAPAFGLYRRNIVLEYLYAHREALLPSSRSQAADILGAPRRCLAEASYSRIHKEMVRWNSPFNGRRLLSALRDGQTFSRGVRNLQWHSRAAVNRLWLARHLHRRIPADPYVVFFMQHLPEASTCSQAPRWVYQDAIVEQLAVNAPAGLKIVVKEHPRSYGRKGHEFFGPLQELPNVVLCHPSVDNQELLARTEAALVITGTVGLEGIIAGARVGVLGRPYYSVCKAVRNLNYPEEIYTALQDPSWNPAGQFEERREFLAAYLQSMHPFGCGEGTAVYPTSGGEKLGRALRNVKQFIETHGLRPVDFDAGLPSYLAANDAVGSMSLSGSRSPC